MTSKYRNYNSIIVHNDPKFIEAASTFCVEREIIATFVSDTSTAKDFLNTMLEEKEAHMLLKLIIPRPDQRGILGGLTILRKAAKMGVSNRIHMLFNHVHTDAFELCTMLKAAQILYLPAYPKSPTPIFESFFKRSNTYKN